MPAAPRDRAGRVSFSLLRLRLFFLCRASAAGCGSRRSGGGRLRRGAALLGVDGGAEGVAGEGGGPEGVVDGCGGVVVVGWGRAAAAVPGGKCG